MNEVINRFAAQDANTQRDPLNLEGLGEPVALLRTELEILQGAIGKNAKVYCLWHHRLWAIDRLISLGEKGEWPTQRLPPRARSIAARGHHHDHDASLYHISGFLSAIFHHNSFRNELIMKFKVCLRSQCGTDAHSARTCFDVRHTPFLVNCMR